MTYLPHVTHHIFFYLFRVHNHKEDLHTTSLVPNFGFIKSAAVNQSSMRHTTATRQGSQAKKLEEIKHANNVAVAAKREAVLIKKLVAAEKNAAAAEARKARATEKKAAQSGCRETSSKF
jgi:hypothetical protein